MEGGGAYGAGKAGGSFDPIAFIKKPQVIIRCVALLFSILVFGCISSQGYQESRCRYNGDGNACSFGIAVGVLAFLGVIVLLVLDAFFDNLSGVQHRKYAVISDMAFSGVWAFFWFVAFCYLTDAWRKTTDPSLLDRGASGMEAAIAFSFFSIFLFGATAVLAFMKYRVGVSSDAFGGPGFDQGTGGQQQTTPSPYSSYPDPNAGMGGGNDPYQQPSYGGQQQPKADFNSTPPTY